MTLCEYASYVIDETRSLIERLSEYELQEKDAKRRKDLTEQKQAVRDAKQVRQQLLDQNQSDPSTVFLFAASTGLVNSDAFRTEWQSRARNVDARDSLQKWQLKSFFDGYWGKGDTNVTTLPACSFSLTFTFRLSQPYLSKDDDAFYIIDNPVRKDKVFKLPMVAPSSWKGSLRHALWQSCARHDGKDHPDERVKRMFGETRADDTGQSGRLFFYPTFFDKMSLEIINPHDRVRRVGKNPILFESVPAGASGRFTLLYIPFDRIGEDEAKTRQEVAEDLELVTQGLKAMFTTYGFGAKTSSGFGVAEILKGTVTLGIEETEAEPSSETAPVKPSLPQYMKTPDQLKPEFLTEEGKLRSEAEYQAFLEAQGKQFTKKRRQLHQKAQKWWERRLQQQVEAEKSQEPTTDSEPPQPPQWQREFQGASQLDAVVEEACWLLQQENTR